MTILPDIRAVSSIYDAQGYKPIDYFDFPANILAFGQSVRGSSLGFDGGVFFRIRGRILTVIAWFCTGEELGKVIERYWKIGYVFKSLNFVNKDFTAHTKKNYGSEFRVTVPADDLLAKMSPRMRGSIRKGARLYEVETAPTIEEIWAVFDAWVAWAKPRHFMLVTGHYRAFINLYTQGVPQIKIIGFRDRATKRLVGIAGGEVWGDKAVTVLFKHEQLDYSAPHYFWVEVVRLFNSLGITDIFQGSTCENLKRSLAFEEHRSYKLDLGKEVSDEDY